MKGSISSTVHQEFISGSARYFALLFIISSLLSTITVPQTVDAHPIGCQLAPNPTFEHGTSTNIEDWSLGAWAGGAGSVSVLNTYTNPYALVQSGSRSAQITVTAPGDVYLESVPWLAVNPNTTYTFSARLTSTVSSQAGLRVIEWDAGWGVTADRWLMFVSGSGQGIWTTLSGSFTTSPNTRHVTLRLQHTTSGTFDWDDPNFATTISGQLCVDARHYITQSTPGFKMCQYENGYGFCSDGWKDTYNEFIYTVRKPDQITEHSRDYITHTGTSASYIGVVKNHDTDFGDVWRCAANPNQAYCYQNNGSGNVTYTGHMVPVAANLPIVSFNPNNLSRTQGASLVHTWQLNDILQLNPHNGVQGPRLSVLWERTWAFVASSVNFGGDIGMQTNVLVYEVEQYGGNPFAGGEFRGAPRMERYYAVRGYGRIRGSAILDTDCSNYVSCDGNYNFLESDAIFNSKNSGDYNSPSIVPFVDNINWW